MDKVQKCSSFKHQSVVRDQASHPQTKSNIITVYILIFTFLDREWEDKNYELGSSSKNSPSVKCS